MRQKQHKHFLNTKKLNIKQLNNTHINTKHINTKHSNIKNSNIKNSNIKLTKRKTLKKHQTGGKVIASGTYGCVFYPPLKCDDESVNIADNTYISKLMYKDYAETENKINLAIKKITDTLNIQKYVLVDKTFMCNPKAPTAEDLKTFNTKCTIFNRPYLPKYKDKYTLTSENIKQYITDEPNSVEENKLRILQIQSGGIDLSKYIYKLFSITDINELIKSINELNKLLIDLLMNAIIPLRDNNYCHNDIKAENILIKTNNTQSVNSNNSNNNSQSGYSSSGAYNSQSGRSSSRSSSRSGRSSSSSSSNTTHQSSKKRKIQATTQEEEHSTIRIIDWGLYYEYESKIKPNQIPKIFNDYKFYGFNYPYSVILFNNALIERCQHKIKIMRDSANPLLTNEQIINAYAIMLCDEFYIKEERFPYMENRIEYNNEYVKLLQSATSKYQATEDYIKLSAYKQLQLTNIINIKYCIWFKKMCIKKFFKRILDKYYDSTTHTLNIIDYFNEVYFKNADIWGILTIYNDLLIAVYKTLNARTAQFKLFKDELSKILFKYIINYEYADKPFNIDELKTELASLPIINNPIL